MNDELIREVNDDMRRERVAALWKRFGNNILAVSALVIVFTAGYTLWQNRQAVQQGDMTRLLLAGQQAFAAGEVKTAMEQFNAVQAEGSASQQALASLWIGHGYMSQGDIVQAEQAWKIAAKTQDVSVRNVAKVYLSSLSMAEYPVVATPPTNVPFAQSLTEQHALVLLSEGKVRQAREVLAEVEANSEQLRSLRERAQMLQLMSDDALLAAFANGMAE